MPPILPDEKRELLVILKTATEILEHIKTDPNDIYIKDEIEFAGKVQVTGWIFPCRLYVGDHTMGFVAHLNCRDTRSKPMLNLNGLTCEHRVNPIGIDEPSPRFSWILNSDETNVLQTAYRVLVSTDADFSKTVWDSGRIKSNRSVLIAYDGEPLCPSTRYYWTVEVEDNHGITNGACPEAFFETGLMADGNWPALFISPKNENDPTRSEGWYLSKTYEIRGAVASARIYATALGLYSVTVNGIIDENYLLAPGWTNYNSRLLYQTIDITDSLQIGSNIITAHIGTGWYKGDLAGWMSKRCVYGNRIGFSMVMHVAYEDETEETVMTDETWESFPSPVLYTEIYNGETYDARRETDLSMPPKSGGTGPVVLLDMDRSTVCAQDGPPIAVHEVLEPVELLTDSQGRTILDFGQNLTGWVRFQVEGPAGSEVMLKHGEILTAEGDLYTENLRAAKQEILYILKGDGIEEYHPCFTFQGFRYVLVEKYPGTPKKKDFRAEVVHSKMPPTGDFSCSNPLINQLNHNIHWGMKGNFLDIPTDCPQRDERLGWTGDAQVFIGTACNLRNTASFFTKWLRDMRTEQKPDGGIPHVIPDVLFDAAETDDLLEGAHSATGWADAAVICPWTIYRQYGDERILEENYGMMKRWVECIRRQARDEVIWDTGFHFGDWVALDAKEGSYFGATPNDYTATVFYANSADILSRTAALLGNEDDSEHYGALYRRIRSAFLEKFYTPSGRLAVRTQTAHVLALHFNLVTKEHAQRTVDDLVKIIGEENGHLTTGFLGTPYICTVLARYGRLDEAYKLLLQEDYPSWLYQVKQGATTIWEHWDGLKPDGSLWSPDMNSFNHYAYGSVGYWLYTTMAGLEAAENGPGYKIIDFRPRPGGGITSASMRRETPYGLAEIIWKLVGDEMTVIVEVPCNTSARLFLPGQRDAEILGSGRYERKTIIRTGGISV